jgi:hypothetical protein
VGVEGEVVLVVEAAAEEGDGFFGGDGGVFEEVDLFFEGEVVGVVLGGFADEAGSAVGEFEEVEAEAAVVGGEGLGGVEGGLEVLGGLEGGEEELGGELEADGLAQAGEGGAEGGSAEPAAEEGGFGPILGGRSSRILQEGAQEFGLQACGAGDVRHKFLRLK